LNAQKNHYYIKGFKPKYGNVEIAYGESLKADAILHKANEKLKRRFPSSNNFVNSLLRRNYWQVKNSSAIYAISIIKDNIVQGGTGWACQMAIDLKKDLFVFDQQKNNWYFWNTYCFEKIDTPILTENFAGIGTRNLTENGKKAIYDVVDKTLHFSYPLSYDKFEQKYNHIFVKLSNLEKEGLERNIYYLPTFNDCTKVPIGNEEHLPNNAKYKIKEKWQRKAGYLRDELNKTLIPTTLDAIKAGFRTGTSRNNVDGLYNGQLVNFGTYSQPLYGNIVRVYKQPLGKLISSGFITKEEWSLREGWDSKYIDDNPQILNKLMVDFSVKKGSRSLSEISIIMGLKRLNLIAERNKNKLFFMEDNIGHICGYDNKEIKENLFKKNLTSENIIFKI